MKTPLNYFIENDKWHVFTCDGKLVACDCDKDDARRIVACVNACAGIGTYALESEGSSVMGWNRAARKLIDVSKQRDELQEEVNALKERAEYDLAEFARTLDISYAEINLLKKQRDELLAALESISNITGDAGFNIGGPIEHCPGVLDHNESKMLLILACEYIKDISKASSNAIDAAKCGAA